MKLLYNGKYITIATWYKGLLYAIFFIIAISWVIAVPA